MAEKSPSREAVQKLAIAAKSKKKAVTLTSIQEAKLEQSCIKCYVENPDATFSELTIAASVYLNFILEFPDLTF